MSADCYSSSLNTALLAQRSLRWVLDGTLLHFPLWRWSRRSGKKICWSWAAKSPSQHLEHSKHRRGYRAQCLWFFPWIFLALELVFFHGDFTFRAKPYYHDNFFISEGVWENGRRLAVEAASSNSVGDRLQPCGTPFVTWTASEDSPSPTLPASSRGKLTGTGIHTLPGSCRVDNCCVNVTGAPGSSALVFLL